jgi:hypothetical protein
MPPHSPHCASWGQDNGHHDFNSVSAIHPSARMALAFYRPFAFVLAGTQHVDRQRRLHRICAVSPRLPPQCRCSGDRQPDLGVDGSDNCRHTTTLAAGKETSQTHTGSDADPTDGPTAPSRGNAGRSLIAVKKVLTRRFSRQGRTTHHCHAGTYLPGCLIHSSRRNRGVPCHQTTHVPR